MKSRRARKFWKQFLTLFAVYAILVPAVYLLFDSSSVSRQFRKDPGELVFRLLAIALGIALIISLWLRKDPELRKW